MDFPTRRLQFIADEAAHYQHDRLHICDLENEQALIPFHRQTSHRL
jgi:hypothetical protein